VMHAIVTASVYKKTDYNPGLVTRISQHALLSSQTLGQLFDAIPCPSKEIPRQITRDGKVTGYTENDTTTTTTAADGCVICIEGFAYGDGNSGSNYAE
jgi:snRNA-activating protein complex subunit 3